MTRNNKIRLVYLGVMLILALIFTLIGRSDTNFWLMLERMDYVITIAKIITGITIIYFIVDTAWSKKTSKEILINIMTLISLGVVLYVLFI